MERLSELEPRHQKLKPDLEMSLCLNDSPLMSKAEWRGKATQDCRMSSCCERGGLDSPFTPTGNQHPAGCLAAGTGLSRQQGPTLSIYKEDTL